MPTLDEQIQSFLAQKRTAVFGVSPTRQTPANLIYRKLRESGRTVYAIHPKAETAEGDPCYPDLSSLPGPVDAAVIVTKPENTEKIMQQCIEHGVAHVWMHGPLGTSPRFFRKAAASITSVSPRAVEAGRERGLSVIAGTCPMQFLEPVDPAHRCVRWLMQKMGHLR